MDNQLKILDLSFNRISTLTLTTFQRLNRMERFYLTHNQITGVSAFQFHAMENLIELNLASNKIKHIDKYGFFGVENLQNLDLAQNSLNGIILSTFSKLTKLRTLDLSANRLKRIDLNILPMSSNRMFESLNIANNALKELSNLASAKMVDFVIVGLDDGNRINCTHFKEIFIELTTKRLDSFKTLERCSLFDDETNSNEITDLEETKNFTRKIRTPDMTMNGIEASEKLESYNGNNANIATETNAKVKSLILEWFIATCLVLIMILLCFILERQRNNFRYENVHINFNSAT